MNIKKVLLWIFGLVLLLVAIGAGFFAIYIYPFMKEMKVAQTVQYDKQLTLVLAGGGGNSGILVSDSLVLVVDTKMDEGAKVFYDQVKQIAGNKPIVVINTHVHTDHARGNSYYKGQTIIAGGNYDKAFWVAENGEENLPTQWVKDSLTFKVGDETVTVLNLPFSAHTQSDVFVYLNNRKLIFTGDVVLNGANPAMFGKYNASSAGYLAAFDLIEKRFDIKTVVPGHGAVGEPEVIDTYRQYFKDMQAVANNDPNKDALLEKYKSWKQIPFLMSPSATAKYMKGEQRKKLIAQ